MVERLVCTALLRLYRFGDVHFAGFVRGVEGVGAEFGVGPAGSGELPAAGPVFGEVMEKAT